jgi:transcription elongation factor Elf1
MRLKARVERLGKTLPCPACRGRLAGTVFRALFPGDPVPDDCESRAAQHCGACGRRTTPKVIAIYVEQA